MSDNTTQPSMASDATQPAPASAEDLDSRVTRIEQWLASSDMAAIVSSTEDLLRRIEAVRVSHNGLLRHVQGSAAQVVE